MPMTKIDGPSNTPATKATTDADASGRGKSGRRPGNSLPWKKHARDSAIAVAAPVWAHHSFAASSIPANKGKVTEMEWINPHSWIHMDVKNPDGTVSNWMIEGGSPNALLRRGFTKNSCRGKRDHRRRLSGQRRLQSRQRPRTTFANGTKLFWARRASAPGDKPE